MMQRVPALLLLVAACGDSQSTAVTIDLAALYQHAAQTSMPIDFVELAVTGEGVDLDPLALDPSEMNFRVEVPAGRARVFSIEAWQADAGDGSQRPTTYWGSVSRDLAPRRDVELAIPVYPAGRVFGTVALADGTAIPDTVELTFSTADPMPSVVTLVATSGEFSAPLPAGQYGVAAEVVANGATYALPSDTSIDIVQGAATGPLELTLVESSNAGPVTVNVASGSGAPVAEAAVLLHAQDGTFKSQTVTDPSGIALLDASAGDMVTVANTDGMYYDLYTITGVEPGDVLPFEVGFSEQVTPIGTLSVSMSGAYGRASNHTAWTGCSQGTLSAGAPAVLDIYDDCVNSNGAIDLIVTAEGTAGEILATYVATALPTNGGSVTVDAWDDTALTAMSVEVANPPLAATQVNVQVDLRRNGVQYWLSGMDGSVVPPDLTPVTINVPAGFFQAIDVTSDYYGSLTSGQLRERFVSDTWPATVAADFSGMLSEITAVAVDTSNAARPAVSWSTAAGATEYDATLVSVAWSETSSLTWSLMLAPETQVPLSLPEIPATLPGHQPQAYQVQPTAHVELVDYSFLAGYRAWLTRVGPLEFAYSAEDFWPQAPATSRRTRADSI